MSDDPTQSDASDAGDDQGGGDPAGQEGAGGEPTLTLEQAQEALKAVRGEAASYRTRLREAEQERDQLRQAQMTEQERAVEEAKAAGRAEAEAALKPKLAQSAMLSAMAGKVTRPEAAMRLVDLATIDPDDPTTISSTLEELLREYPEFKVDDGSNPPKIEQGSHGSNPQVHGEYNPTETILKMAGLR